MNLFALVFLALGLSVDSMAVSITVGICAGDVRLYHAVKVGFFFAFFQTLMPFAGYLTGLTFSSLIAPFDHWIALGLLSLVGIKMIYENIHEKRLPDNELDDACPVKPLASGRLAVLGFATSIDALAAGVTLSMGDTSIVIALVLIGGITFIAAGTGTLLGRRLGVLFQRNACITGGVVLILIGVKIVFDHYSNFTGL